MTGGVAPRLILRCALLSLIVVLLFPSDVVAQKGVVGLAFHTPVLVTLLGPDPVRVRIATGRDLPCDASRNKLLIDGRFPAGSVLRASALGMGCVCFQQTYAPFANTDWSTAQWVCSACGHNSATGVWVCPPGREPTIAFQVKSSRGNGAR
jgi:hypothetical protein